MLVGVAAYGTRYTLPTLLLINLIGSPIFSGDEETNSTAGADVSGWLGVLPPLFPLELPPLLLLPPDEDGTEVAGGVGVVGLAGSAGVVGAGSGCEGGVWLSMISLASKNGWPPAPLLLSPHRLLDQICRRCLH